MRCSGWSSNSPASTRFAASCTPRGSASACRPLEAGLYRLVQEALTNVAKHARADQVTVTLARAGEGLSLIIEDDGVGFDPAVPVAAGPSGGFGLAGMRERAALLGGKLLIPAGRGRARG